MPKDFNEGFAELEPVSPYLHQTTSQDTIITIGNFQIKIK